MLNEYGCRDSSDATWHRCKGGNHRFYLIIGNVSDESSLHFIPVCANIDNNLVRTYRTSPNKSRMSGSNNKKIRRPKVLR
jgi:hypothetical protein